MTEKQKIARTKPKPRYSLVTRQSRHGVTYGVYDRALECEWIVSNDQADALNEIRRRLEFDALWDKPQWPKSAVEVLEEEEIRRKRAT